MIEDGRRRQWEDEGFFVLRGFADAAFCAAMEEEIIAAIRADPPSAHAGKPAYATAEGLIIQPEAKPTAQPKAAEDLIAKVFNPHVAGGRAEAFAHAADTAAIVRALLGAEVSVFQSQFIFKNAGAWGQPWHQDSYYFPFDRQPQVGLWLAISEATLENGCLSVLPGSHKAGVLHEHGADERPGANQGYLEVKGLDERQAVPMLMELGDILVFHSFLLHRSEDNRAQTRRSAMVYHYSETATRPAVRLQPIQEKILLWRPLAA